jgi:cell division protein FtsZ
MFRISDDNQSNGFNPFDNPFKVIGVGGGGLRAVNHMIYSTLEGVDFICTDADAQALKGTRAKTLIQLGFDITKGLAPPPPGVVKQEALEHRERIAEKLFNANMVFIIVGMGGSIGTHVAPVIADVAKELGILTVAVVTTPFPFEGRNRRHIAEDGIAELVKHVDSLIRIPNEKLLAMLCKETTRREAFKSADDLLLKATRGVAELMTRPREIGIDFADLKSMLSNRGMAAMGIGAAIGSERAREAAESAMSCPLLDEMNLVKTQDFLVNITAGRTFRIAEFDEVCHVVRDFADDDAIVMAGALVDRDLGDGLRVTIVATGRISSLV